MQTNKATPKRAIERTDTKTKPIHPATNQTPLPKVSPFRGRRRGSILLLTFWVLLIVGAVLMGLQKTAMVTMKRGQAQLDQVKARWLARAAVEKGIEQLVLDITTYDSMTDYWYSDPVSFQDVLVRDGSGDAYALVAPPQPGNDTDWTVPRYGMVDAASLLNANEVSREVLMRLPEFDEGVIDALIDWRDENTNSEPGGAERAIYDALSFPYDIRNGKLRTPGEMRLLHGMTAEVFYQEDTNGNGLLDPNENDGAEQLPDDDADSVLDLGWQGLMTVFGHANNLDLDGAQPVNLQDTDAGSLQTAFFLSQDLARQIAERGDNTRSVFDIVGMRGNGRVEDDEVNEITFEWVANHWEQISVTDDEVLPAKLNVNTASRDLLKAVLDLPDAALDQIVSIRMQQGGFASVGELFTLSAVDEGQFRNIADLVTVRSDVFIATGVGTAASGVQRRLTVVLDRSQAGVPKVLFWREH